MQGFKEMFEAYGADYQTTMTRFIGNETMYLRFLDMLFQDTNPQKLSGALESGDLTGAFEAAHTLKGVAANMGLAPLSDAVSAIVEPLRNREQRDDYLVLYRAIQVEFERADDLRRRLKGGE